MPGPPESQGGPPIGAGSPEAWLRYARSDFALACIDPPEGVLSEMLCFHAQQAAGLSVYAVLTRYPADFAQIEQEEYQEAIVLAEGVLEWVASMLG